MRLTKEEIDDGDTDYEDLCFWCGNYGHDVLVFPGVRQYQICLVCVSQFLRFCRVVKTTYERDKKFVSRALKPNETEKVENSKGDKSR